MRRAGRTTLTVSALIALGLTVLFRSLGTIFAKQAAFTSPAGDVLGFLVNPWYIAELVSLGLQAVTWLLTLKKLPLTFAYPFLSISFCLNLLAAVFLFDEPMHLRHLIGVVVILAGTIISATGGAYGREAQR